MNILEKVNLFHCISETMDNISLVQNNLNKMFCLQRKIGSFMDDVMKMNPVNDADSVMHIQLNRHDALCYTDIVLDYLATVSRMIDDIDKTLAKAFELAKIKTEEIYD